MEKERLLQELDRVKKDYKKEKAKLEWAEDDFEESLIVEAMERLKRRVRELRQKIDDMEASVRKA